jgi:hypothetical protein
MIFKCILSLDDVIFKLLNYRGGSNGTVYALVKILGM